MADDWKRPEFRQNVVKKINEAIADSIPTPSYNGTVMESHIFPEARNKLEYLSFAAKLILHVRENVIHPVDIDVLEVIGQKSNTQLSELTSDELFFMSIGRDAQQLSPLSRMRFKQIVLSSFMQEMQEEKANK